MNPVQIDRMAREFIRILRRDMTPEDFQEMRRANRVAPPGVCASHDYLDANEAMQEAWDKVMRVRFDPAKSEHAAMWSRAWSRASHLIDMGPWMEEFGRDYRPPAWVELLVDQGRLIDTSWRNDLSPSFSPADDDPAETFRWQLFVTPQNRALREIPEMKRYAAIGLRGGDDVLMETDSDFKAIQWVLANL